MSLLSYLKILLFIMVSGVLVGFIWVLKSGLELRAVQKPKPAQVSKADIHLGGLSLNEFQDGAPRLKIKAAEADYYNAQNVLKLNGIQGSFQAPDGRLVAFKGGRGEVNSETRDFILEESGEALEVQIANGLILKASNLRWNESEGKLDSSEPIEISGNGFVLNGRGFSFNIENQEMFLESNVHLSLQP